MQWSHTIRYKRVSHLYKLIPGGWNAEAVLLEYVFIVIHYPVDDVKRHAVLAAVERVIFRKFLSDIAVGDRLLPDLGCLRDQALVDQFGKLISCVPGE